MNIKNSKLNYLYTKPSKTHLYLRAEFFWSCKKMMDINIIQTLQNSSLGKISNFVSNHTLHKHLKITTVLNEAKLFYKRFHNKLHFRPNHLIKNVSTSSILGSLPKAKIVS